MKRVKARDEIMLKKCSRISRLNSEEPIFPKPNRNSDSVKIRWEFGSRNFDRNL